MENSKQFLKTNNIFPRISFKDKQAHRVKLLNDKIDSITDQSGKMIEGVKYFVEEGGAKKTFFTSSVALISKLSECKENDVVNIQIKYIKGNGGKLITSYDVWAGLAANQAENKPQMGDTPMIDDSEINAEEIF